MSREVELRDSNAGTVVRLVIHDGALYIESVQKHEGVPVANLARVPLDVALPELRRLVLT